MSADPTCFSCVEKADEVCKRGGGEYRFWTARSFCSSGLRIFSASAGEASAATSANCVRAYSATHSTSRIFEDRVACSRCSAALADLSDATAVWKRACEAALRPSASSSDVMQSSRVISAASTAASASAPAAR